MSKCSSLQKSLLDLWLFLLRLPPSPSLLAGHVLVVRSRQTPTPETLLTEVLKGPYAGPVFYGPYLGNLENLTIWK